MVSLVGTQGCGVSSPFGGRGVRGGVCAGDDRGAGGDCPCAGGRAAGGSRAADRVVGDRGVARGRPVMAREELVEALAASATGSTVVAGAERSRKLRPRPCRARRFRRGDGLPVTVLAPDYQRILGALEERPSAGQGSLQ